MKMLVSDYDRTYYLNDQDVQKNNQFVDKFMKENLFVMATGRSYSDFNIVKEKYNLKYHYLILNHGATIIKEDKILENHFIHEEIKQELIKLLNLHDQEEMFAYSGLKSKVSIQEQNITKIHLKLEDKEKALRLNQLLNKRYGSFIHSFLISDSAAIEIVSNLASKDQAISQIASKEKIQNTEIYTIGDDHTDIGMIKRFHGYAIKNAIEEVKNYALKEYDSVYMLIKDIMIK